MDPRYRFKNQTIIEMLEITAEEEREMRTIISDDERRRRRRKDPDMTRRKYETQAAKKRTQARKLVAEGLTRQEIAEVLQWTKRHVQRVLNEGG